MGDRRRDGRVDDDGISRGGRRPRNLVVTYGRDGAGRGRAGRPYLLRGSRRLVRRRTGVVRLGRRLARAEQEARDDGEHPPSSTTCVPPRPGNSCKGLVDAPVPQRISSARGGKDRHGSIRSSTTIPAISGGTPGHHWLISH